MFNYEVSNQYTYNRQIKINVTNLPEPKGILLIHYTISALYVSLLCVNGSCKDVFNSNTDYMIFQLVGSFKFIIYSIPSILFFCSSCDPFKFTIIMYLFSLIYLFLISSNITIDGFIMSVYNETNKTNIYWINYIFWIVSDSVNMFIIFFQVTKNYKHIKIYKNNNINDNDHNNVQLSTNIHLFPIVYALPILSSHSHPISNNNTDETIESNINIEPSAPFEHLIHNDLQQYNYYSYEQINPLINNSNNSNNFNNSIHLIDYDCDNLRL